METINNCDLFGMTNKEYEEKIPIVKTAMDVVCFIAEEFEFIWNKEEYVYYGTKILEMLKDQDRIARQEERERCIQKAIEVHCGMCPIYEVCHNLDGGNLGGECHAKEYIRKSMEGGNNGNA